jgi:hypothetical protein
LRSERVEPQSLRFGPLRLAYRFDSFVSFLILDVAFKRRKPPRRLGVDARLLRRIGANERGGFRDTGVFGVGAWRCTAVRHHRSGRRDRDVIASLSEAFYD